MSNQFVLFRAPPGGSLADLLRFAMYDTIGPVDSVQEVLARFFPTVDWQLLTGLHDPGLEMMVWRGVAQPVTVQLIVENDGCVRTMHLSQVARNEVERIAKDLRLVALDEQSLEILGERPLPLSVPPAA